MGGSDTGAQQLKKKNISKRAFGRKGVWILSPANNCYTYATMRATEFHLGDFFQKQL